MNFGAAIGSEKPKNGKARLTKLFLYFSMSFLPSIIYKWTTKCQIHDLVSLRDLLTLYSSRQTSPVAKDVVVAIAGIILPAICFVFNLSAGAIP